MKYVQRSLVRLPISGLWRSVEECLGCGLPALFMVTAILGSSAHGQFEQQQPPSSIHGVVINRATREPVPRALVFSPDNRFATLTDSQGRFEFAMPQKEQSPPSESASDGQLAIQARDLSVWIQSGPSMLMARKPGFLPDPSGSAVTVQNAEEKDWTITLIPEALLVGKVTLPNSEPPDSVQLELYRRMVQDGRARWVFMKSTASRSDGEFRFADLPAGTYKLLTRELLDRDPLTFDPRGQLYGYPPVYYPTALGFSSASEIAVAAGEIARANLALTRQPYYNVKIPVINAQAGQGFALSVFAAGNRGPGFSLAYNAQDQAIEGLLPNGTYTVEATSFGPNNAAAAGSVNVTVHNGVVSGPSMVLSMGSPIPVTVKEEFTSTQKSDANFTPVWTAGGRSFKLTGPRRYLDLTLEPEDDFGRGRPANLRSPSGPNDQALVVENALPGRYWVRVHSSRGYVASMRSGNIDLLQQPLTVSEGATIEPIEITMRDETAEIEGTVDGLPTEITLAPGSNGGGSDTMLYRGSASRIAPAHVYCVPLPGSGGSFMEMWVSPDGHFHSAPLAPGAYRVLAFARPQSDLEYHNLEAMQAYDSKGEVVRLSPGQKETLRVPLITTE